VPKAEAPLRSPVDAEELAAFVDGRLQGERRRLMMERLADDEDAYELYEEVIRVRDEIASDESADPAMPALSTPRTGAQGVGRSTGTASVVQLPTRRGEPGSRRSRVGWWAAAAAAALVVLSGWLLLSPPEPGTASVELLAAFDRTTLGPKVTAAALDHLVPVPRGGDGLTREQRATHFQLGVRAFDLALAAAAGDRDATEAWIGEIHHLLVQGVPVSFMHQDVYEELSRRHANGEPPASLERAIADAEADLAEELDSPETTPYFAFGRWVEAMRVAAVTEDRRFLDSRAARHPLGYFLVSQTSPAVAENLARVSEELKLGADGADLEILRAEFLAIIHQCARGNDCLGD
jgi:hypothetical protein